MTILAEPGTQVRPPEPRSARDVLVPFLVYTVALGVVGYGGEFGPVWGLLIAAATIGLFWWIGLTRSPFDAIVIGVGGIVGGIERASPRARNP